MAWPGCVLPFGTVQQESPKPLFNLWEPQMVPSSRCRWLQRVRVVEAESEEQGSQADSLGLLFCWGFFSGSNWTKLSFQWHKSLAKPGATRQTSRCRSG